MEKIERKIIYILLITIIIACIILIIKIKNTPNYDTKLYAEVYEEYNEIIEEKEKQENTISLNNNINTIDKEENNYKKTIGIISIPSINIFYPIMQETTDENLKVAPSKLTGASPNTVGNLCIVGHNYRNQKQFSNLKKLNNGDIVEITDKKGITCKYKVYDKYEISPYDLQCLNQETDGKKEVTLITCTNDSKNRLVVKCIES
jgi:sortase A